MSDEESEIVETAPAIAPGLALALAEEEDAPVRRRRGPDPLAALRTWQPRTSLR